MSKHKLIIALVVVAVSLGGWATLRNGDAPPAPADTAALPPVGGAGLIATTGDGDAAKVGGDLTSTSHEGLVEQPGEGPAGGTMVDLQGRFRSAMTATVVDSDSVVVECTPDTAPGGGR